jgi:hypothetical protein
MRTLADTLMVFHDSEGCDGIISSDNSGRLICTDCRQTVGLMDPDILAQVLNCVVMLKLQTAAGSQRP